MVWTTRVKIHDLVSQLSELVTLKWLGEEIGKHMRCGTMFDCNHPRVHKLLDVEESQLFEVHGRLELWRN